VSCVLKVEGLVECTFLKRRNRFVVEVLWENELTTAHLPNTGRLKGILFEGQRLLCKRQASTRKHPLRIIAAGRGRLLSVIDTSLHEEVFRLAALSGIFPWLEEVEEIRRNPRIGDSTYDFLLLPSQRVVEIKSALYKTKEECGAYPDAPSLRGRRHLEGLIKLASKGVKTLIIFSVGVPRMKCFSPLDEIDPMIRKLLREADAKGVMVRAFGIHLKSNEGCIAVYDSNLPVIL